MYESSVILFQEKVEERKSHIKEECDSLITEIELKREFFLSDLEYEEKSKTSARQAQVSFIEISSVSRNPL